MWARAEAQPRLLSADEDGEVVVADAAPVPLGSDGQGQRSTMRSSEIEAYARCPRQYAYRYVYGLRPREVGVATLRRALHETLRAIERTGAATAEDTNCPPLAEALRLFEANWEAALASEMGTPERDLAADVAHLESPPFDAVYRRHGRAVVERAWHALARRVEAGEGAPRRAAAVDFERTVSVDVGGKSVNVTLDRVEPLIADASLEGNGRTAGRTPQPAVFVRHRLGRASSPQADLRALFYALAAEQHPGEAPATLLHHNLSTDERTPAALNPRQRTRLTEELRDALDGMARTDYAPRPQSGACESCPFLLICPA